MATKLKVNMISESAFTVQGHGVHTAFRENFESLKREGVDIVANHARPADITHIQTVGPYSLRHLLFGSGKKVISAHVTPDSFVGSLIGAQYWYGLAKLYLRWVYNRADGVLAVSQEVVDELQRLGVRRPIFLVPNTIDTSIFTVSPEQRRKLREKLGIAADDFVVLGSGQVQPRKRIDTFARCAAELPEIKFVWVGGIPFKKLAASSAEMARVMETKLPNLTFTGLIERREVIDYYKACDLFFLPSIQETFGIVIVEAAAAGMPVLLRDIPQYRVTFKDWYAKGQEEDFTKLITKFAKDKAYYRRMAKTAQRIAQQYDSVAGAKRLLEVYLQVLA
jgi:1,2-diacylglycerol-3-alpha-glucose alpha-1,2-galactosyltransferase